ncbi:ribonuclease III [Aspergillus saccharolyticus JOP 1030-1]|uniref:Ribonuclease III n=1 Tax=Aspergillus saccharolyticus JOP 1030-1 TaxID=1450539 RepID=A0A318Z1L7_9EURO|nr:ribonuclease III [Aspergillus saccharolyticus JOP 1030-1]PYH41181.1 ribonuclease III [Aspergillus saccharolyticus JOP 1030-1]
MPSKRKSVFSPLYDRDGKKLKHNAFQCASTQTSSHGVHQDEALSVLRNMVRNIIDNRRTTILKDSQTSSHIMRLLTELDVALCRAGVHVPSFPTAGNQKPRIAGGTQQSQLPDLPPISDDSLRSAVFTHPGMNNDLRATYDRLEVLGDAYIEVISTRLIWDRFQDISSGRISQIREILVKNETLAEFATRYEMDNKASVPSQYADQPKRWTKTQADIFEAYVAGLILSDPVDGYATAEQWLTKLWMPMLDRLGDQKSTLDAKEALAKKIMGKGVKLHYTDERPPSRQGKGAQTFYVGVYLTGWGWTNKHLGSGQGTNKAIAGDEAARQALRNASLIDKIVDMKKADALPRP